MLIALAVALRNNKTNRTANWFLILFLVDCFFSILLKYIDYSGEISNYPYLRRMNYPVGLLRPPLFFLYIFHLLKPAKKIVFADSIHFLLPLLCFIYFSPVFLNVLFPANKLWSPQTSTDFFYWYNMLAISYSVCYLVACLKVFRNFLKYKEIHNIAVPREITRWIRFMLFAYAFFLASIAAMRLITQNQSANYLAFQSLSVLLIASCVKLLSMPQFPEYVEAKAKYSKSTLTSESKDRYFRLLEELIIQEQLFKNERLRLKELSQKLNIPEYQLSQVINETTGSSFTDYINNFRVNYAKEILLDTKYRHLTIEALGYEAGFQTKASFYNAFKKKFKQTPSQLRTEAGV